MKCSTILRFCKSVSLALSVALFSGCSSQQAPTVDSSSDETYAQSLIKMRDTLSSEERDELADSLLVLGLVSRQPEESEPDADKRFMLRVQGKTAQQIIMAAQALRSRSETKKSPQIGPQVLNDGEVKRTFTLSKLDRDAELEAPEVAVDSQGRIYVAWASKTSEGQRTFYLTVSTDAGQTFSVPQVISQSAVFETEFTDQGTTAKRGVLLQPHVGAIGDRVILGWTQSVAENATVCLVSIESTDGARTFSKPVCVHQSLESRPIETSMSVANNSVAFCWLDNRSGKLQAYAALRKFSEAEFTEMPLAPAGSEAVHAPTAIALGDENTIYVATRLLRNRQKSTAIIRKSLDDQTVAIVSEKPCDVAKALPNTPSLTIIDAKPVSFDPQVISPNGSAEQGNCKTVVDRHGIVHAVWEEERVDPVVSRVAMYSCSNAQRTAFSTPVPLDLQTDQSQSQPALAVSITGDVYAVWNNTTGDDTEIVFKRLRTPSGHR